MRLQTRTAALAALMITLGGGITPVFGMLQPTGAEAGGAGAGAGAGGTAQRMADLGRNRDRMRRAYAWCTDNIDRHHDYTLEELRDLTQAIERDLGEDFAMTTDKMRGLVTRYKQRLRGAR